MEPSATPNVAIASKNKNQARALMDLAGGPNTIEVSTVGPALAHAIATESLLARPPEWLEPLPLGCYACDATGKVRWFNEKAAQFWSRKPLIGDDSEKYCGSHKLYSLDGSVIRREHTPMAHVLRTLLTWIQKILNRLSVS